MKTFLASGLLLFCPLAFAQLGTTSGPGVLSRVGPGVGQRSGQDLDVRYFVNASGIYDTGLTPYALTSAGTLVQPEALYGIEAGVGGYGRHTFRRSAIGLDYYGNFRHYTNGSRFDGSNQQFSLEYSYQKSRRLIFDFGGAAGTQTFGTAFIGAGSGGFFDSGSLLFDNRMSYHQTSFTTRYALTGRTAISVGGNYYEIYRKSAALIGVKGYNLQGSISHQMSRSTIIGAAYQHTHYDFPRAFGESDINVYTGNWTTKFGRSVDLTISGGVFTSDTQGVQRTALDPTIAALLGIGSIQSIFFRRNVMPTGSAALTKRFRRSSLNGTYSRTVFPGNGVFLTSRQETYSGGYAYTGARRWSASIDGNVWRLDSLGQALIPYKQLSGTASLSYNLGAGFHLSTSYMRRHQDIQALTFRRDSSRISFGIVFSPGEIPISFR